MHIIDELRAISNRYNTDPIVFVSDFNSVWTLGMVLSMWEYVFEQSESQICERGIPFQFCHKPFSMTSRLVAASIVAAFAAITKLA